MLLLWINRRNFPRKKGKKWLKRPIIMMTRIFLSKYISLSLHSKNVSHYYLKRTLSGFLLNPTTVEKLYHILFFWREKILTSSFWLREGFAIQSWEGRIIFYILRSGVEMLLLGMRTLNFYVWWGWFCEFFNSCWNLTVNPSITNNVNPYFPILSL